MNDIFTEMLNQFSGADEAESRAAASFVAFSRRRLLDNPVAVVEPGGITKFHDGTTATLVVSEAPEYQAKEAGPKLNRQQRAQMANQPPRGFPGQQVNMQQANPMSMGALGTPVQMPGSTGAGCVPVTRGF